MSVKVLKIASAICVIALVACGVQILGRAMHIGTRYDNAGQYTAGGAALSGPVKNLDINWTDGEVNIVYHGKNTVEISETARKPISGDAELRWWLDGDTLRIQYAKSGFLMFRGLNKALTVTLPEDIGLGDVGINATSADVNVPELRAGSAAFGLTSGDLRATLADVKSVSVNATSGDIEVSQTGAADSVRLSSTSGKIVAAMADAGALAVSTTSGDIRATFKSADEISASSTSGRIVAEGGGAQKARLNSTSGDIDVRLEAFGDLKVDATSGNVAAALPSEPGYRADISTTSGSFDYEVALAREGGDYTCGDGSGSLHIHTTSGDIRLTDVGGE